MIVNRIVAGFVMQRFDDERGIFVGQDFIGEDGETWEDEDGEPIEKPVNADYLPIELVQPKGK